MCAPAWALEVAPAIAAWSADWRAVFQARAAARRLPCRSVIVLDVATRATAWRTARSLCIALASEPKPATETLAMAVEAITTRE